MALGVTLNVTAANEHVPGIERRFRVIRKELDVSGMIYLI